MTKTPLFVKLEEYKEILDILDVIKNKVGEAKLTIDEIKKLKNEEDRELGAWSMNLEDVARRIDGIDKTIMGR